MPNPKTKHLPRISDRPAMHADATKILSRVKIALKQLNEIVSEFSGGTEQAIPAQKRAIMRTLRTRSLALAESLRAIFDELSDEVSAARRASNRAKLVHRLFAEYFETMLDRELRDPSTEALAICRAFACCQFTVGTIPQIEQLAAELAIEASVKRDNSSANRLRLAHQHGVDTKDVIRFANRQKKAA